jgi:hypothetical protein
MQSWRIGDIHSSCSLSSWKKVKFSKAVESMSIGIMAAFLSSSHLSQIYTQLCQPPQRQNRHCCLRKNCILRQRIVGCLSDCRAANMPTRPGATSMARQRLIDSTRFLRQRGQVMSPNSTSTLWRLVRQKSINITDLLILFGQHSQ